jgi:hypothetical protein
VVSAVGAAKPLLGYRMPARPEIDNLRISAEMLDTASGAAPSVVVEIAVTHQAQFLADLAD